MSSFSVLLINAILYTATLIYFFKKYRLSVGVLIWTMYTVSAWSSFLFIQQPGYASSVHASEQTMFPCIYLYIIFVISMLPLMKLYRIENVDFFNKRIIKAIMVVCIVVYFLFFVVDLPVMTNVASIGTNALSALRQTVYGDEGMSRVTQNVWLNRVSVLFLGMRVLATGLSVIVFSTYKDNRRLVNLFFIACLLNNIRVILTQVGRGEIVLITLLYASIFYLVRDYLSEKRKRALFIYALPIVSVGVIFFWAITISRFGDRAGYFMFKYMGESINNFNGILFKRIQGTTNGRAYFALFYRYLLGETQYMNAIEKWSLINSITGIRGDIFYTWVGGLIIEFGKIVPVFVAIILNRIMNRLASLKDYYYGDVVVLIFFINFYIRGLFNFPTQNIEGTFMILYTFLLYILFRIQRGSNGSIVFKKPKRMSRKIRLSR